MKKILSVLVAITISFSFASVAEAADADGTYGNLKYEITDGEASIIDCDAAAAGTVEIPELIDGCPVTKIGDEAFEECRDVTEITIPDTVSYIGFKAFTKTAIRKFVIPDGVSVLRYRTFDSCTELEKVVLPEGLNEIEYNAFAGCSKLSEVNIPSSVTKIGSSAFRSTAITSVVIPEGVNSLNGVFNSCRSLVTVELPVSLTEIGRNSFYFCDSLTTVNLPENLQTVGYSAFYRCEALKEIDIPSSVSLIDEMAFFGCTSLSGSVIIPDGIEEIKTLSFYDTDIVDLYLPLSVTAIADKAFGQCSNLENIYYAGNAEDWNNISVCEGSEYISYATVHYNYGKNEGDLGENLMWDFNKDTNALSVYGSGAMVSYGSFEEYPWSDYKDKIEYVYLANGVASVGDNAFNGCSGLKEVFLGNTVEKVGQNAFSDCPSLAIVTAYAEKLTAETNSFGGNDDRLVIIHNAESSQVKAFAQENDISAVAASYDRSKNVLGFSGEFIIYPDLDYNMLARLIQYYPDTKYLFFEKLVFDGVTSGLFDIEGLEGVLEDEEYLTFSNLYISISAVKGDGEESITFAQFIGMLESGDHEGFLVEIESDSGKESVDFMRTVEHFVSNALKMVSKLINLISKIFKR